MACEFRRCSLAWALLEALQLCSYERTPRGWYFGVLMADGENPGTPSMLFVAKDTASLIACKGAF